MEKYLVSLIFLFIITLLFYYGIINGVLKIDYSYWLPIIWLLILFPIMKLWSIEKVKLLIFAHVVVVFSGIFSFFLYHLYLNLKSSVSFKSDEYTSLNNLMFNSEKALYVMIYLGIIVFFVDLLYFVKLGIKKSAPN